LATTRDGSWDAQKRSIIIIIIIIVIIIIIIIIEQNEEHACCSSRTTEAECYILCVPFRCCSPGQCLQTQTPG